MISIEHDRDEYLVCRASGKLTRSDYEAAIPELENELKISGRPLRMLIVMEDFRGWEMGALWEDLRFDIRRGDDFDRIAIVGNSRAAEWGTRLARPFFSAEIRHFSEDDRPMAEAWLAEKSPPANT